MEFYYYLSLIFSLLLVKLEAVPIKSTDHSNAYLQSLGLRLGVLQDIANQMESDMSKYDKFCKVSKDAKMVYELTRNNSGHKIAAQQIDDICNWMITHTDTSLDCNTTMSSLVTIETACNEVSLYAGLNKKIDSTLLNILGLIETIPNKGNFAKDFTADLPNAVQAVICAPYGC